jgi:NAD+ synthase
MTTANHFSRDVLKLDVEFEVERICASVKETISRVLRRRGAVVGLSGGVDSSVVAALSARALGPGRVLGLLMPETDSSHESVTLGREVGEVLGIETLIEDVGPILTGAGCYRRRDEAIRSVIPEYGEGYKNKLVVPSILSNSGFRRFRIVVESPDGVVTEANLPADAFLAVVAATNFKQRARKMMEYHYADKLQYAVAGTPNRLEYDQGFFVKNGDGAADFKPIAHLYKTQVYQLAEYLGIPEVIRTNTPTTDTYSMAQTQEEFFFSLPYDKMDLCLYGVDHEISAGEVAEVIGLTEEQAERVYLDIDSKRRGTSYLHTPAQRVEGVPLGVAQGSR